MGRKKKSEIGSTEKRSVKKDEFGKKEKAVPPTFVEETKPPPVIDIKPEPIEPPPMPPMPPSPTPAPAPPPLPPTREEIMNMRHVEILELSEETLHEASLCFSCNHLKTYTQITDSVIDRRYYCIFFRGFLVERAYGEPVILQCDSHDKKDNV